MLVQYYNWMAAAAGFVISTGVIKIALYYYIKDCATEEERRAKTEEFLLSMMFPRGW